MNMVMFIVAATKSKCTFKSKNKSYYHNLQCLLISYYASLDNLIDSTSIAKQDYNKQKVQSENYHDKTKQARATVQLESGI
jgi:hypothetical protein